MIVRTRYNRSLSVKHRSGSTDSITDTDIATSVLDQFLHYEEMGVTETMLVPYHAVEYVEESMTQTQEEVDNLCDLTCSVMPDPTLTVPQETITVEVGEEFDPMIGVSATDGNNHDITDSVTVEATEPPTEGYLMTEDSVDILNENDEPLIGE